jgi:lipopolysaccharide heptosyltransferase II
MATPLLDCLGLFLLVNGLLYLYWVHASRRLTVVRRGRLYQSGAMRPAQLLRVMRRHGIDTVIDFRGAAEMPQVHRERQALAAAGLRHAHVPCGPLPSDDTLRRFLDVMNAELGANRRILMHCKDGEGRAVAFAAVYRMEFEGWSPIQAYRGTTRLPPPLRFVTWILPFAGRLSRSNPKSRLILTYSPRLRAPENPSCGHPPPPLIGSRLRRGHAMLAPTENVRPAMKVDTQRVLDFYVGIPLCALVSLFARVLGSRRLLGPPRRILVILLSEMGSMVCTQPMFAEFERRHPGIQIHVLVLERNRAVVDLLALVPPERIITVSDAGLWNFAAGALRATRRLRQLKLDVAVDCELFSRISALFAFASGARIRVGFHRHTQEGLYRGTFLDRPVLYNPYAHIAVQFLSLARALDSQSTPFGKERPMAPRPKLKPLAFSKAERRSAAEHLYGTFPALRGRPLVLLYAGAGPLPVRAWPIEHFASLAAKLLADGCAVAVIGLAVDAPLARSIVERCAHGACVDLTAYTETLRELLLIFHAASLLISNDGGPNHFAALTPIPIVSLFGPETPVLYAPLAERAVALSRNLPCSPCLSAYNHRRSPCDGDNQCLRQIAVTDVLHAARRLLTVPCTA